MGNRPQLDPALKAWLDRVLVPALVEEYLRDLRPKKGVAFDTTTCVDSAQSEEAS